MSWLTWSNWCWYAWGWSTHQHRFNGIVMVPLLVWAFVACVAGGFLEAEYRRTIPVGARRTLAFLIGGAVASTWPIVVGGLVSVAGSWYLWSTVYDTVSWLWEIARDTTSWAVIGPIKRRHARKDRKEFPTAKVVNQ